MVSSMAFTRRSRLSHALAPKRNVALGAALAFIWLAAFSPPSARAGEQAPIDASRIVSIGGAVTETIYALGLEDRIVGVDATSLYPPEALKRAPNVGYMSALSAEGIRSLKPSWVIAIDGSGPPAALKLVSDAGVPLTTIHDDPSPDGVAAQIETIGKLLGVEEKATVLANDTRDRFALVEHMRPQTSKPPRVLFILCLQNGQPMVGGRGTAADAVIQLAGAANAANAIDGYKPMTDEGVIVAAPDVILKMNNGNMVGGKDDVFSLPAFAATPAAASRALIWYGRALFAWLRPARSRRRARPDSGSLSRPDAAAVAEARRPTVRVSLDDIRPELRFEANGRRRIVLTAVALVVLLVLVALFSLTHGAVSVPGGRVAYILVHALAAPGGDLTQDALVVTHIRLPRLFLDMMIGAALAASGALMRGLFRNPLADPGLAGVSAGAGLGAALAIVFGDRLSQGLAWLPSFSLRPAAAFLGALAATSTLYPSLRAGDARRSRRCCSRAWRSQLSRALSLAFWPIRATTGSCVISPSGRWARSAAQIGARSRRSRRSQR